MEGGITVIIMSSNGNAAALVSEEYLLDKAATRVFVSEAKVTRKDWIFVTSYFNEIKGKFEYLFVKREESMKGVMWRQ